jgi:hypothetical protein
VTCVVAISFFKVKSGSSERGVTRRREEFIREFNWGVISNKSHATRHTSHVTRHTSHVTRHTSHVTRHTSHVTRHTSHVACHLLLRAE